VYLKNKSGCGRTMTSTLSFSPSMTYSRISSRGLSASDWLCASFHAEHMITFISGVSGLIMSH
jgi:hypothetical protein